MDKKESMLNKWDYSNVDEVCYSDDNCESYKRAVEFLGADQPVEDWGGGTGWAKRYFTGFYKNIDGSNHKYVDLVADLIEYKSDVDNILMRQVLELNVEWRAILENVKKSFKKKLCLIIFTPFADETHIGEVEDDKNLIYFNKNDVLSYFPENEFNTREEVVKNGQGYGEDWILYVERV